MAESELKTTGQEKPASAFWNFLPKLLPCLACGLAGVALLFTFLIGVSNGSETSYIYDYFSKVYDSYGLNSAMNTSIIIGTVVVAAGLVAVLAFTGFTVYFAVKKFVKKEDCPLEKFALATFLSYIAFAVAFYALHSWQSDILSVKTSFNYNAATIAGFVIVCLVACAYVACKALVTLEIFKYKANLANAIYNAVILVMVVVVAALAVLPLVKMTLGDVTTVVDDETVSTGNALIGSSYAGNFIAWITNGALLGEDAAVLSNLSSSATAGYISVLAIIGVYLLLAANLLSDSFGKKANIKIPAVIVFVLTVFSLFFAVLASSFFTDLFKADGEEYLFNASYGIAISVAALSLSVWIAVIVKPYILGAVLKNRAGKAAEGEEEILLEVKNLCQYFPVETNFFGEPVKFLKAVDDVSFKLKKGKTLGIVGESGCGKTTMGRSVLHLYDITSGEVYFKGEKISGLKNNEFDKLRPNLQMIFQDPYASLSPRLTVGEIIGEAARQHGIVSKADYHDYVLKVMKMCGLQPHYFERYPHEFSGGQRQRICIARALALKPEVVVCDEPVSALDVSIQAQIINMLIELRKTLGLTYIFISHDLSVVKHISDEVGVMYLGSLVEYGSKDAIFSNTLHPYTKALFSAVPVPNPHVKMNRVILKGDIPSPVNPPAGCKFHTRCDSCMNICTRIKPLYKEVEKGHFCACHLYDTEEEVKRMEADYAEEQRLLELQKEEKVKFNIVDKIKNLKKSDGKDTDNAQKE